MIQFDDVHVKFDIFHHFCHFLDLKCRLQGSSMNRRKTSLADLPMILAIDQKHTLAYLSSITLMNYYENILSNKFQLNSEHLA